MKRIAVAAALLLAGVIAVRSGDRLTDEQQQWLAGGVRQDRAGWIYLRISGDPRARGFQYGYLLAKEIEQALRVRRASWKYESARDWSWLVEHSNSILLPKVDRETLAELDGMVEGLGVRGLPSTREELVAFNGYFELSWYWWPIEKRRLQNPSPDAPKQACSSFIATGNMTSGGAVVLGHNTMLGYHEADANVILDIVPARGHRIMMQAFPGWIHSGTDFFVTDAGLVGSETTVGGFSGFDDTGVPEFVRMRRATQDAGSIDEWCAIMKRGNNGGYANAWLLGDVNTGEIARLELGLRHVAFEKKRDGYFVGSNVAEDLEILRNETEMNEVDIRNSPVARRVRWKQLMREHAGKIDVELAKRFEADHFDAYEGRENPSGRTLCGHAELDPQSSGKRIPYEPSGTIDAKVVDTRLAKRMSFFARWGSACGMAFEATTFLRRRPQFEWMADLLKSRPSQPWTEFRAADAALPSR